VSARLRCEIGVGIALAAVTIAVYATVRHHDFVDYDDFSYVVENPRLRSGLGLRSIATETVLSILSLTTRPMIVRFVLFSSLIILYLLHAAARSVPF